MRDVRAQACSGRGRPVLGDDFREPALHGQMKTRHQVGSAVVAERDWDESAGSVAARVDPYAVDAAQVMTRDPKGAHARVGFIQLPGRSYG